MKSWPNMKLSQTWIGSNIAQNPLSSLQEVKTIYKPSIVTRSLYLMPFGPYWMIKKFNKIQIFQFTFKCNFISELTWPYLIKSNIRSNEAN